MHVLLADCGQGFGLRSVEASAEAVGKRNPFLQRTEVVVSEPVTNVCVLFNDKQRSFAATLGEIAHVRLRLLRAGDSSSNLD